MLLTNVYPETLKIIITHPFNVVMLIKQRHLSFTTPCVCLELLRFKDRGIQSLYTSWQCMIFPNSANEPSHVYCEQLNHDYCRTWQNVTRLPRTQCLIFWEQLNRKSAWINIDSDLPQTEWFTYSLVIVKMPKIVNSLLPQKYVHMSQDSHEHGTKLPRTCNMTTGNLSTFPAILHRVSNVIPKPGPKPKHYSFCFHLNWDQ